MNQSASYIMAACLPTLRIPPPSFFLVSKKRDRKFQSPGGGSKLNNPPSQCNGCSVVMEASRQSNDNSWFKVVTTVSEIEI